jgi:STE24 endopeptidase
VVGAVHLWRTTVPSGLLLPDLGVAREFRPRDLEKAESFEAFARVSFLLSQVVLIAVLVAYARRGAVFVRESAAGPIGTGFLLGMLGLALVWIAQLPFGLVELWWARRHDVLNIGYVEWLIAGFFALGGEFLFLCLALLVAMALARLLPRMWWIPTAACYVGLFALFAFTAPWLVPGLKEPKSERLRADATRLAAREGVPGIPLRVEEVRDYTDQPNAYAFGLGSSRRVVLWDTIVGFPRREVRAVVAHEYAHHASRHVAKQIGWFALLVLPGAFVVALVTRRRGGLAEPTAVPVALLTVTLVSLAFTPLLAAASRRYEAEADWRALRATNDPAAMKGLFRHFTTKALADPDPPGWWHTLFESHPTGLERVRMAESYQRSTR